MKPHPRIRKTIKWGGAAATALLFVVWIGSGWWTLEWVDPNAFGVVVSRGVSVLGYEGDDPRQEPGSSSVHALYHPVRQPFVLNWRWFRWQASGSGWALTLPLWFVSVASLLVSGTAWRLDALARRRAMLNLCPKCNYDRAGLAAGALCPECGAAYSPGRGSRA